MHAVRSVFSLVLAASLLILPVRVTAGQNEISETGHTVRHVLLISVDGLHALDLTNYVATHHDSTLASLSRHGITYTNNSTSTPSDSFPGLASLVTGGSPTTTGFWYDVTFNRALSPPTQTNQDPFDLPGAPDFCPSIIGTEVGFDEEIDVNFQALDGGGGINPNFLPRDPNNGCKPVFPHAYLRVNTIFEVVKANGGRTAWVDKHPSYEWTNGPSGHGVDDFFGPEINSNPVALPFPGCTPVPQVDNTPDDGWTTDFRNIQCYDLTHVQAVLNQIDGFTHDGSKRVGIPALFGMNFQAVSVGQKLNTGPIVAGGTPVSGGYTDVLGTPGPGLAFELDFVDHALGMMVSELKKTGHLDSTLIIIAAKHGQSPIDVSKKVPIGGGQPATLINTLGQGTEAFDISDDGSLIWLSDTELTPSVVALLSQPTSQAAVGIQEIFAGASLRNKFNDPGSDPRTPDIILKTNTGVIFTGGPKLAEHGGFNEDDVHTALLVSLSGMEQETVKTPTSNQQVAASIVKALGIDPNELQAVKKEQIKVLPFLFTDNDGK